MANLDESFIPFEQIEPLLEEGMTGQELAKKLAERLGLPVESYKFALVDPKEDKPLTVRLRGGLRVEKVGDPNRRFLLNAEPVR